MSTLSPVDIDRYNRIMNRLVQKANERGLKPDQHTWTWICDSFDEEYRQFPSSITTNPSSGPRMMPPMMSSPGRTMYQPVNSSPSVDKLPTNWPAIMNSGKYGIGLINLRPELWKASSTFKKTTNPLQIRKFAQTVLEHYQGAMETYIQEAMAIRPDAPKYSGTGRISPVEEIPTEFLTTVTEEMVRVPLIPSPRKIVVETNPSPVAVNTPLPIVETPQEQITNQVHEPDQETEDHVPPPLPSLPTKPIKNMSPPVTALRFVRNPVPHP